MPLPKLKVAYFNFFCKYEQKNKPKKGPLKFQRAIKNNKKEEKCSKALF